VAARLPGLSQGRAGVRARRGSADGRSRRRWRLLMAAVRDQKISRVATYPTCKQEEFGMTVEAEREKLVAKLADLDKQALGAEALRSVARLHAIRAKASQLIVDYNADPKATEPGALFLEVANLA